MSVLGVFIVVIVSLVLLGGLVLLYMNNVQQNRRIDALQQQLSVFVDTSIDVARCVDEMKHNGVDRGNSSVGSRRWLLSEARHRQTGGSKVTDIVKTLALSQDEARLLRSWERVAH
ncbi:MAG: hypothetical protein GXP16_04170 [Gammaproteobacteria bacterium]|nr:hypothetical protein [Gammaproteobacteria bacterium]